MDLNGWWLGVAVEETSISSISQKSPAGAFIYEYGDHGGLVVMADDVRKTKLVRSQRRSQLEAEAAGVSDANKALSVDDSWWYTTM